MLNIRFKSLEELTKHFESEQACINHLETLRWNGNVVSPFDSSSKVYRCKNNKYRCKNSSKYFNVRTNTMFDNTRVKLQKWFMAIWLIDKEKDLMSNQLSDKIGVSQKTARLMMLRIKDSLS